MALQVIPSPLPEPSPNETTGQRIDSARRYRRLTQQMVVDQARAIADDNTKAFSLRTLSAWIHDTTSPTVRDLVLLGAVLDVDPAWFVMNARNGAGPNGTGPGQYAPWDSNPEPAD